MGNEINKLWVLTKNDSDNTSIVLGVFDDAKLAIEAQQEQEGSYNGKYYDFDLEEIELNVKPAISQPPPVYHTCLTKEEHEWKLKLGEFYMFGSLKERFFDKMKEIGFERDSVSRITEHYEEPR